MNLANKLTMLRIFLIPVFMIFLLINIPHGDIIATAIFIFAASTDGLDGYIARKRKEITNLGKLLDPLADKMLVTTALVALVELGRIPAWVVILILAREFFVTGLRGVAAAEGVVIAASKIGKVKTVTQIVAIVFIMLENYIEPLVGGFPIGTCILAVAVFFTLYSGYDYIKKACDQIEME